MRSLDLLRASILASLGLAACRRAPPVAADAGAAPSADVPVEATTTKPQSSAELAAKQRAREESHAKAMGLALGPDHHAHRPVAATCNTTIPGNACPPNATGECGKSSACKNGPNGQCLESPDLEALSGANVDMLQLSMLAALGGGDASTANVLNRPSDASAPAPVCSCSYACASDADCKKDEACICEGDKGHSLCVPATCRTDADCKGTQCELSEWHNGCGMVRMLACRTPKDACQTSADCGAGGCGYASDEKRWTCMAANCAIGRPLFVDGDSRSAAPEERDDWIATIAHAAAIAGSRDAREAARWTEIARMEHASIASFARFTLELLALGAPLDLVRDAQRAALDEVEHARLAFELASTHAGAPIGPGPLDVRGVVARDDVREIVCSLVHEGCAGETIGAAEAARDAAEASGVVAHTFERIARDEERHATLAWVTLRWLLETHPAEARDGMRAGLRAAQQSHHAEPFRARVMRDVVEPCVAELSYAFS
jgi:hypothetical protein